MCVLRYSTLLSVTCALQTVAAQRALFRACTGLAHVSLYREASVSQVLCRRFVSYLSPRAPQFLSPSLSLSLPLSRSLVFSVICPSLSLSVSLSLSLSLSLFSQHLASREAPEQAARSLLAASC